MLYPERDSADELARWHEDLVASGYAVAIMRDISAPWREHVLAKHARRWQRRERFRSMLGAWVEPELQVSAAMLGLYGSRCVASDTRRYEFEAESRSLSARDIWRAERQPKPA